MAENCAKIRLNDFQVSVEVITFGIGFSIVI